MPERHHPTAASPLPSVLLIDDETDILPEYQELLELEGITALTTDKPQAAAMLILKNPTVKLVVTDLKMAGIDGVSLIRHLRAVIPADRNLGFMILTGDATSNPDTEQLGVPILLKPIDLERFIAAINSALASTTL